MRGIDVSSYQKKPDWSEVKESGIEFAILRIMDSKGEDASFEHNYAGCRDTGIARGAYRYSYALSNAQAKAEAKGVLTFLAGRKLEMGVWLDLEWNRQRELGRTRVRDIANIWMRVIRSAGYECNIYCNKDWYENICGGMDAKYWIARYPAEDMGTLRPELRPRMGEIGWQYSQRGRVAGISGNVDMDIWYSEVTLEEGNPYKEPEKALKYIPVLTRIIRQDVKWLQWDLRESGYDMIVDGKFGPVTDMALRAFQAEHPGTYSGEVPDGVCGAKTRAALKAASAPRL